MLLTNNIILTITPICKALCRSQKSVADHDDVVVKGMIGWGKRRGKGGKVCLNSRAYTHLLFC